MWFIFICACIVVALAALIVMWIGSKILRSIEKHDRQDEIEQEITDKVKRNIRNSEEEN